MKTKKRYDLSLIFARNLLHIAKKDENDILRDWESKSEKNVIFKKSIIKYWNQSPERIPGRRMAMAKRRLIARIESSHLKTYRTLPLKLIRAAALIILLVSVGSLSVYLTTRLDLFENQNYLEVSTQPGQQSQVLLPDGSIVWLNAATKISYNDKGRGRKVRLSGEAFFNVKNDDNNPFLVSVGETEIKVLGTQFNVQHYENSKYTETSLLSGKISMNVNGIYRDIVVNPGEKMVYNSEGHVLMRKKVEVSNEILWKKGILVFENERFDGLILKLERFYGVSFKYDNEEFLNIHYTGTIDNLSITKVLEFINHTIPIDYEIDKKTIQLSRKK